MCSYLLLFELPFSADCSIEYVLLLPDEIHIKHIWLNYAKKNNIVRSSRSNSRLKMKKKVYVFKRSSFSLWLLWNLSLTICSRLTSKTFYFYLQSHQNLWIAHNSHIGYKVNACVKWPLCGLQNLVFLFFNHKTSRVYAPIKFEGKKFLLSWLKILLMTHTQ